ncbi:MAG TPA: hypothetical protein VFG53_18735 [Anaeromyxobacter sp.]|nr:hypothetical protein [Anaeromyxobacter sp.]
MADLSIDSTITNGGGPPYQTDSSITVNSVPKLDTSVELSTPNPLKGTLKIEPTDVHITSDSKISTDVRLTFEDTFRASIELKPVLADLCLNVRFAPLPPTRVRQPYCHRLSLSFLGFEVLGLNLAGELETTVEDAPRHAALVGPASAHRPEGCHPGHEVGGLHIRLGH